MWLGRERSVSDSSLSLLGEKGDLGFLCLACVLVLIFM